MHLNIAVSKAALAVGSIATILTSSLAVAQTLPSASPVVVAQPVAPAASPAVVQIAAQTTVTLTTNVEIKTKTLKLGDQVELVTVSDIVSGGKTLVPAGAKATATVSEAVAGRAFGKGGRLMITFQKLVPASGEAIELNGTYTGIGQNSDSQTGYNLGATGAALAGSFGAVGALVGLFGSALMRGHSAVIKPGAKLTAYTSHTLQLAADGATLAVVPAPSASLTDAGQPASIALSPAPAVTAK